MKKGFSLIEIIQTVVLLGIIAGLSISFFKNNSNERRLYEQTVRLLQSAEQEAARQMCSDSRIICQAIPVEEADRCVNVSAALGGQATSAQEGYCCYSKTAADDCIDINGIERITISEDTEDTLCCYPPICRTTHVVGGTSVTNNSGALLTSTLSCPNGIPNYNANRADVNGNPVLITELCRRLYDIINHKPQGLSVADDFIATCVQGVNPCITAAGNTCPTDAGNDDRVNMILPNGARIYGLSSPFADDGTLTIYIKYDRVAQVNTLDKAGEMQNTDVYVFRNPSFVAPVVPPAGP